MYKTTCAVRVGLLIRLSLNKNVARKDYQLWLMSELQGDSCRTSDGRLMCPAAHQQANTTLKRSASHPRGTTAAGPWPGTTRNREQHASLIGDSTWPLTPATSWFDVRQCWYCELVACIHRYMPAHLLEMEVDGVHHLLLGLAGQDASQHKVAHVFAQGAPVPAHDVQPLLLHHLPCPTPGQRRCSTALAPVVLHADVASLLLCICSAKRLSLLRQARACTGIRTQLHCNMHASRYQATETERKEGRAAPQTRSRPARARA